MNAQTIEPFDSFAAYIREREHARKIEGLLSNALILLGSTATRLELRGEDMAHVRRFIKEASR